MTPLPPSAGRALTLAEQRLHDVRAAAASCATLGVDLARVEAEARIGWEGVAARRLVPRIHVSEATVALVMAIGGDVEGDEP